MQLISFYVAVSSSNQLLQCLPCWLFSYEVLLIWKLYLTWFIVELIDVPGTIFSYKFFYKYLIYEIYLRII